MWVAGASTGEGAAHVAAQPVTLDGLYVLVARALAVRYRRSSLGFAWSLLQPLMAMAVLTAVFANVFTSIERYPVYVIVGVFVWGFFSLTLVQAMDSLLGAAPILRRVAAPPALFPLAVVAANLVHLLLSLALLVAVGAVFGFVSPWLAPAALAALFPLALFTAALALVMSAVCVFFHDVRYFAEGILLLGFYATPVMYPASIVPERWSALLTLNPMVWLLAPLRDALWAGRGPDPWLLALTTAAAALAAVAASALFARLSRRFYLYL
ncbi:MAG: ABC transporter permease [Deltaproteobacteria bacterium]|nr:ABC transporter permease [Deltaproteobacteria bacterium]